MEQFHQFQNTDTFLSVTPTTGAVVVNLAHNDYVDTANDQHTILGFKGFQGPQLVRDCSNNPSRPTCTFNIISNASEVLFGIAPGNACLSGEQVNGAGMSVVSNFSGTNTAYMEIGYDWPGNPVMAFCGPVYNNGGMYSDGTPSSGGAVLAYPWHPATQPSCSIGVAGSTCTTSTINLPHSGMQCSANPVGTGLIGGVGQFAPGIQYPTSSTMTITANFVTTLGGGGTDTFSVVCN